MVIYHVKQFVRPMQNILCKFCDLKNLVYDIINERPLIVSNQMPIFSKSFVLPSMICMVSWIPRIPVFLQPYPAPMGKVHSPASNIDEDPHKRIAASEPTVGGGGGGEVIKSQFHIFEKSLN